MKKKALCFILLALILATSCGCSNSVNMPFNGDISFHAISLTIPERFIRDSTQSTDDIWVFEYRNYTEYILITRNDASYTLESYRDSMRKYGSSELISFSGQTAVHSTYQKDDVFCQELLFICDNTAYAVALRGGSEATFQQLLSTIQIADTSNHETI